MNLNKKIIVIPILLIISNFAFSQSKSLSTTQLGGGINAITTAVPFLMISPDARAGGMGDVGVATSPDANSTHWNAAKYAFIKEDMGFSVSYTPWLRALVSDINLGYISGYKKIGTSQTVSASLLYFSLGDITFTDVTGQPLLGGSIKPYEVAVDVAYSRKFTDNWSGGLAARYIYSNLTANATVSSVESYPGKSVAADISAYYRNDVLVAKKKSIASFGVAITNIGSKMTYTKIGTADFIPINLRIGGGLSMNIDDFNNLGLYCDLNKLLVPTPGSYTTQPGIVSGMISSFSDAPGGAKEEWHEIDIATGMEYWYDKQFAVRTGFFYENQTKGNRQYVTFGAGLKYNVFSVDFAYLVPTVSRNPLENTLRFTLLFNFAALSEENAKSN